MLILMHYLNDAYYRLHNLQTKFENEIRSREKRAEKEAEGKKLREKAEFDFGNSKAALQNAFLDMAMVIEESRELDNDGRTAPLIALGSIIPIVELRIKEVKTLEDAVSVIKMLINPLTDFIERGYIHNFTAYSYGSHFRNVWDTYGSNQARMSEYVSSLIERAIVYPNHDINVLEMHCREKDMVPDTFAGHPNVRLYGLDSSKIVQRSSREKYRRIIYGNLKGCVITNDSFDIVFCFPPVTKEKTMKMGVISRNERDMLRRSSDFLKIGGTLVYALPYYRYTRDICEYIAKNYINIQIFSTWGDMDMDSSKYIYVIGQRKSAIMNDSVDIVALNTLRNLPLHWKELVSMNPKELAPIQIPDKFVEVKRFRGSELNEEEIEELYASSRCTASFWKDQNVEKLSEAKSRPLLPFNVGQLGLVLTSGCLDGIIEEPDGSKHAVKGRVIKRVEKTEDIDSQSHQIQVTSTVSNRVEINAFLPDGTYKCLA